MEIKLPLPRILPSLHSPKAESRGVSVIHQWRRSISGNGSKYMLGSGNLEETVQSSNNDKIDDCDDMKRFHRHPDSIQVQKLSERLPKDPENDESNIVAEVKDQHDGVAMSKNVLEVSKGVASDLRVSLSRLLQMKDLLVEKVAAARPSVPTETLEHARRSIESIIHETTQSAYGRTRDAISRIRLLLVEIVPYFSHQESKKIVDEAEQEVLDLSSKSGNKSNETSVSTKEEINQTSIEVPTSTASAAMGNQRSSQISVLTANMDRIKSWALFRARM